MNAVLEYSGMIKKPVTLIELNMGSGMMCPMCGKMMGQGMMGGQGMMNMMHGTISGPGMMAGFGKPDLIALAEKLDLSEEQIAEIKGIFLSHKKDIIRKKADRDIAELELSELTQQDEPDLNAVEDKIRDIANLETGIRFSQIKVWTDARSVLTTEQKAVLKKIMKEQKASMTGQKNVEKTETSMPGSGGHSEHH
jgi:Spy/CpxP family protein refolding chaperone